jgi:NADPH:quinone reductase-like Zn-dependent oxidoreductase
MKGVSYSRFGGSEVLECGELPEPKLSQNAVIVRMKAAVKALCDGRERNHPTAEGGRHPRIASRP